MKRILLLLTLAVSLEAQTSKPDVLKWIDATKSDYDVIAQKLWEYSEIGYQEVKSAALLQEQLTQHGF